MIKALFLLSVLGFGLGYVFTNSVLFGLCIVTDTTTEAGCINFYERLGDPFLYGAGALALVFLILLILPRAIPLWKKFAAWFVPLAALLFIFYPNPGAGDMFSPSAEKLFQIVSSLYVLVSVLIVLYSFILKRP